VEHCMAHPETVFRIDHKPLDGRLTTIFVTVPS
jgi:hypothetical protein